MPSKGKKQQQRARLRNKKAGIRKKKKKQRTGRTTTTKYRPFTQGGGGITDHEFRSDEDDARFWEALTDEKRKKRLAKWPKHHKKGKTKKKYIRPKKHRK